MRRPGLTHVGAAAPAGLVALVCACALACPPATLAAASHTSHATSWTTRGGAVACGIAKVFGSKSDAGTGASLNGFYPGLQCSAKEIPRAPGGVGDPFVQLGQGRAGRANIVDESQNDLIYKYAPVALPPGTTWSLEGITCKVSGASIRCHNSAGHGFNLATQNVTVF